MKELKYERAWDNRKQEWVTPDQVDKCEGHDRNRYFTEKFEPYENKGKVLTLHNTSTAYKNKNGKDITRRAHFSAIADNTREYRVNTEIKQKHQESLVHKLCKEVIKQLEFIRIPSVSARILDKEIQVIPEQYIKNLNVKSIEQKDELSGRIPDAVIEAEILGKKQDINIEFYYKHPVDENKRLQYQYYNMNCLEVSLVELRDNLDDSDKALKNKIRNIIQEKAYWVSNRLQLLIEKEAIKKYVIEISKRTGSLKISNNPNREQYESENDWLEHRLFFFKDQLLGVDKKHKCRLDSNKSRYTDIGECQHCNNCIWIENYTSLNTDKTAVYCRKDGENKRVHPIELINNIINYAIEIL